MKNSASFKQYARKPTNWMNLFFNLAITTLCGLFIAKEVTIEDVMRKYIADKTAYTNFHHAANLSNAVTYFGSVLLALLMAKSIRLLRFANVTHYY